jgi:hypothetical protein
MMGAVLFVIPLSLKSLFQLKQTFSAILKNPDDKHDRETEKPPPGFLDRLSFGKTMV